MSVDLNDLLPFRVELEQRFPAAGADADCLALRAAGGVGRGDPRRDAGDATAREQLMSTIHPWAAFLAARLAAIVWLREEERYSAEMIRYAINVDPVQLELLYMTALDQRREARGETGPLDVPRVR